MSNLEGAQNRIINKQTDMLTKIDTEVADLTLKVDAMDEGFKAAVTRIDKDLGALDDWVNRLSRFSPLHSFSSKFKAPKHSFKS